MSGWNPETMGEVLQEVLRCLAVFAIDMVIGAVIVGVNILVVGYG